MPLTRIVVFRTRLHGCQWLAALLHAPRLVNGRETFRLLRWHESEFGYMPTADVPEAWEKLEDLIDLPLGVWTLQQRMVVGTAQCLFP